MTCRTRYHCLQLSLAFLRGYRADELVAAIEDVAEQVWVERMLSYAAK